MLDKESKILIVSTSCLEVPPPQYGGLEQMVYNLALELGTRDYDVTCAAPRGTEIPNVSIIETIEPDDSQECFKREPEAYYQYSQQLPDFDFIIDHSWQKISYIHKGDFPDLMKDSHIIGVWHGMPSVSQKPPVEHPNYVSVSKAAAKSWEEHTGLEVRHCYNGISVEDYPLRDNLCTDGDYFLTLNRIMPEKGIDLFCDLCEEVGVEYKVIGEDQFVDDPGFVHEIMAKCANSELGEYRGTVSQDEKISLLQNAKATILLPTRGYEEVFGLAAVESAACGTPPIVLNNNGLGEIVSEMNQSLVCENLKDVKYLMERIEHGTITKGFNNERLRERAKLYSRENMADMYLQRCEEVLESSW